MCKSNLRFKYALFAALWILSFLALIILPADNKLNTLYNNAIDYYSRFKLPKNQTGTISYFHLDPEKNYRPVYSVYSRNLRVENNNLGIFKTALHKAVKIQDLELRFYQYTSPEEATTTISHIPSIPEDMTKDTGELIKNVITKLATSTNKWFFNMKLGNVSEILVNNFDYRVFYNNDLFLAVQSKKATVSYKEVAVTLRGHVTIKVADGSTLESNHVQWNVKKQHFTINGFYVLNRDGIKTIGENSCVDFQLNNVKFDQAKLKRKETQKCFAKLQ